MFALSHYSQDTLYIIIITQYKGIINKKHSYTFIDFARQTILKPHVNNIFNFHLNLAAKCLSSNFIKYVLSRVQKYTKYTTIIIIIVIIIVIIVWYSISFYKYNERKCSIVKSFWTYKSYGNFYSSHRSIPLTLQHIHWIWPALPPFSAQTRSHYSTSSSDPSVSSNIRPMSPCCVLFCLVRAKYFFLDELSTD